jgi:hypothetical protein
MNANLLIVLHFFLFFLFSKNGAKIKNWIGVIQNRECQRVSSDEIRISEVQILIISQFAYLLLKIKDLILGPLLLNLHQKMSIDTGTAGPFYSHN